MADRLKDWARIIKRDVPALDLASRDPRVPWYAKAMAVVVAGYALSPIDLIPHFIPVLGYLDDVILVPLPNCSSADLPLSKRKGLLKLSGNSTRQCSQRRRTFRN